MVMSPTVERMDYGRTWIGLWTPHPYRLQACAKEPFTVAWIEALPEGCVLHDIGANVGSYSLIAGKLGHPVVAIEPMAANYADLVRNSILNGLNERIIPIPMALGEVTGLQWLHLSDPKAGAANHFLGQPSNGNRPVFMHRTGVLLTRLDAITAAFQLPPPTHVKIDTDGNEIAVLNGFGDLSAGVQQVMIETKDPVEQQIGEVLRSWGLEQKARFAERGGNPMIGLSYGYWVRPA